MILYARRIVYVSMRTDPKRRTRVPIIFRSVCPECNPPTQSGREKPVPDKKDRLVETFPWRK